MKKANKAILSLTLALAVSSFGVACTDQGAVDDRTYRGAGQYQGRGNLNTYSFDGYNLNNRNHTGMYDNRRNLNDGRARGLFTSPRMNDGGYNNGNMPQGGLFYGGTGYRMGNDGQNGMFGNDNGLFGNDNQNGMFGDNNQNGMTGNNNNGQNNEHARNIERQLNAIPGVENCQVVVNGDDVVAGVDTNGNNEEVMKKVRQKLNALAPNQDCYVTTDENLRNRLRDMDGLLRNNDETAGERFRDLVNDIGNRITR